MNKVPRILIVEPDDSIRLLLMAFIEQEGFVVEGLDDVSSLRNRLDPPKSSTAREEVAVVDLVVMALDDIQAVSRLRESTQIPLIVLANPAGRTNPNPRLEALEAGADDLLLKPFDPRELVANVRAMMRRLSSVLERQSDALEGRYRFFDGYQLDTVTRQLVRPDGTTVELSGTSYELLSLMANSSGHVVTRERISEVTRGCGSLSLERFIDVQISRLRSSLGDNARALIKTVRGKGYVMAASVESGDQSRFPVWPYSGSLNVQTTAVVRQVVG
jgi:two-component system OmpR family response regulator